MHGIHIEHGSILGGAANTVWAMLRADQVVMWISLAATVMGIVAAASREYRGWLDRRDRQRAQAGAKQ